MSTDPLDVEAPPGGRDARWRGDAALALLLLALTVGYLVALPLALVNNDEGNELLAAKRLLDGEVLYRDVFSFTTPGWPVLMSWAFALFGATLATARVVIAVIHGATAVLLFTACRQLGVGRPLAWACGISYLVFVQPVFPIATYHWLTTCLGMLLLVLCLRATRSIRWALALGLAVGLPIVVHQQRGLAMGVGVAGFLVARARADRWYGETAPAPLGRQLLAFGAGVALVVGTVLAAVILVAGFGPVWNGLVIVPLFNYRGVVTCGWGHDYTGGLRVPFVAALPYLPLALALTLLPLGMHAWRRQRPERVRELIVLTSLCAGGLLSILYYPDTTHLAMILPLFLVLLTDAFERGLGFLPPMLGRRIAGATAFVVIVLTTVSRTTQLSVDWNAYPVAYHSAFGRIDMPTTKERDHYDQLRAILAASPSRVLFVHPAAAYTHLLVDARNPVRFPSVSPRFTSADQIAEIIADLHAQRVPWVFTTSDMMLAPDRLATYVREHYDPTPDSPDTLWRRRDAPAAGPTAGVGAP